jgi:hypothetical protein
METTLQPQGSTVPKCARGYSLVLPPGWRRIPLRAGTQKAIRAAVKEALATVPRDAPQDRIGPQRLELERRLQAVTQQARSKGGIDIYLPVGPVYAAPVAASFLVSELSLKAAAPPAVVAWIASEDDTWQPVPVDGADGLRVERAVAADPADDSQPGSRRVDYVVPVPGRPGSWLVAAFSTLGGGSPHDELAQLLTDLFDAIMITFSWEWQADDG